MKISDSEGRPPSGLEGLNGAGPASKGAHGTAPAGPSLRADRVQLSNLSAHLTASLGGSAAHLQKLSSLASGALNGGYQVDAGVVSDSIIRHSLQFGGTN
jgi:hypothetical protein